MAEYVNEGIVCGPGGSITISGGVAVGKGARVVVVDGDTVEAATDEPTKE